MVAHDGSKTISISTGDGKQKLNSILGQLPNSERVWCGKEKQGGGRGVHPAPGPDEVHPPQAKALSQDEKFTHQETLASRERHSIPRKLHALENKNSIEINGRVKWVLN